MAELASELAASCPSGWYATPYLTTSETESLPSVGGDETDLNIEPMAGLIVEILPSSCDVRKSSHHSEELYPSEG